MIKRLEAKDYLSVDAVAKILKITFPWSYGNDYTALEEAKDLLSDSGIVYVYEVDNSIVGLVGAKPQYGKTGWELHPLAVLKEYHNQGIGSALIKRIEESVKELGGIVMYLGTDDEHFRTSLSKIDLFDEPFEAIKKIENYQRHPYEFYQKLGYQIVGVIPDVNGFNKPDIFMAKRLVKPPWKDD